VGIREPGGIARDEVSVVVIEDHPLFREALTRTIRDRVGMKVVAEVGLGREGIDAVRETRPDVCVLDLVLPDISGVRVLSELGSISPDTRVLVVSGDWDDDIVYAMLAAGASGFQLKTAGAAQLGEAIAAIARGETVLPPELHGGIAAQIRAHSTDSRPSLTDREVEILRAVADGHSAAEIGSELNLAESTVKTHLTRIYDKLGVSERAAAVAYAMRHGLID
jgi:two-component system nitrate/nitrite response regulator NarL